MSAYKFIEAVKAEHATKLVCRALKVSRAAYYRYSKQTILRRHREDLALTEQMALIRRRFGKSYGSVRMWKKLHELGIPCGLRRVRRLMAYQGWFGRRNSLFRHKRNPCIGVPDLIRRDFGAKRPGEKYVGDMTQMAVRNTWLYLAVVIDCFSRRVVGYSMGTSPNTELVTSAILMATERSGQLAKAIFHSDRGSQYTSEAFCHLLSECGFRQSLGAPGQCWDNAMCESFFASLKKELAVMDPAQSLDQLKSLIFEYIECFYNPERLHSALGYLSPTKYEEVYYGAQRSA